MQLENQERPLGVLDQELTQGEEERVCESKYARIVAENQGKSSCFLSVVIATEGKHPERLQDTLLCLQGQADQDFEIILVIFRGQGGNDQVIRQMISTQGEAFQKKIRIAEGKAGSRGAAMNLGMAMARGDYVAFLTEDDLLFDHWVQSFHEGVENHEGMILRSYTLAQEWSKIESKTDWPGSTTVSGPDASACVPFETMGEGAECRCIGAGIAFPMDLFRDRHFLMNEGIGSEAEVEYLIRGRSVAGIYETTRTVGIRRSWQGEAKVTERHTEEKASLPEGESRSLLQKIGSRLRGMMRGNK